MRCSACGQKTAVLYVDNETGEYLPEEAQRCDRENKCGHHVTPKEYFASHPENGFDNKHENGRETEIKPSPGPEFIPFQYIERSLSGFKTTHFATYLTTLFGERVAEGLLLKYFVGRSKNDDGKACIFWQIDEEQNVRYGKIMCYDPVTGKRRKDISPVAVPVKPDNYLQTFFGCHLLMEFPQKQVAIVESEKTAIVSNLFMPQYNWLATGGSSGCKWREYAVYKVLKGKDVLLFPDFGYYGRSQSKPHTEWKTCYREWSDRARHIEERIPCKIRVSTVLEKSLPEDIRLQGLDLADFLIKQDKETGIALSDDQYPAIWDAHKTP